MKATFLIPCFNFGLNLTKKVKQPKYLLLFLAIKKFLVLWKKFYQILFQEIQNTAPTPDKATKTPVLVFRAYGRMSFMACFGF